MRTLSPYLVFKGNCEEAFNFYKIVFDGQILFMGRYTDVPEGSRQFFPDSAGGKIMHATLQIDTKTILMGCDGLGSYEKSEDASAPDFYLYISTGNQEDAYRIFNELSAGGIVTMPIAQTFWSNHYGMVIDKFGIHWKITFDPDRA
jgi:PhnB protein